MSASAAATQRMLKLVSKWRTPAKTPENTEESEEEIVALDSALPPVPSLVDIDNVWQDGSAIKTAPPETDLENSKFVAPLHPQAKETDTLAKEDDSETHTPGSSDSVVAVRRSVSAPVSSPVIVKRFSFPNDTASRSRSDRDPKAENETQTDGTISLAWGRPANAESTADKRGVRAASNSSGTAAKATALSADPLASPGKKKVKSQKKPKARSASVDPRKRKQREDRPASTAHLDLPERPKSPSRSKALQKSSSQTDLLSLTTAKSKPPRRSSSVGISRRTRRDRSRDDTDDNVPPPPPSEPVKVAVHRKSTAAAPRSPKDLTRSQSTSSLKRSESPKRVACSSSSAQLKPPLHRRNSSNTSTATGPSQSASASPQRASVRSITPTRSSSSRTRGSSVQVRAANSPASGVASSSGSTAGSSGANKTPLSPNNGNLRRVGTECRTPTGSSPSRHLQGVEATYLTVDQLLPLARPGDAIRDALRDLKRPREDWVQHFNALDLVRSLVAHHCAELTKRQNAADVRMLMREIRGHLSNLRSGVVKNALLTVREVVSRQSKALLLFVERALPQWIGELLRIRVAFLEAESMLALEAVVQHCSPSKCLKALLPTATDKTVAAAIHSKVAKACVALLQVHGYRVLRAKSYVNGDVLVAVGSLLGDGAQDTRTAAKMVLSQLVSLEGFDKLRKDIVEHSACGVLIMQTRKELERALAIMDAEMIRVMGSSSNILEEPEETPGNPQEDSEDDDDSDDSDSDASGPGAPQSPVTLDSNTATDAPAVTATPDYSSNHSKGTPSWLRVVTAPVGPVVSTPSMDSSPGWPSANDPGRKQSLATGRSLGSNSDHSTPTPLRSSIDLDTSRTIQPLLKTSAAVTSSETGDSARYSGSWKSSLAPPSHADDTVSQASTAVFPSEAVLNSRSTSLVDLTSGTPVRSPAVSEDFDQSVWRYEWPAGPDNGPREQLQPGALLGEHDVHAGRGVKDVSERTKGLPPLAPSSATVRTATILTPTADKPNGVSDRTASELNKPITLEPDAADLQLEAIAKQRVVERQHIRQDALRLRREELAMRKMSSDESLNAPQRRRTTEPPAKQAAMIDTQRQTADAKAAIVQDSVPDSRPSDLQWSETRTPTRSSSVAREGKSASDTVTEPASLVRFRSTSTESFNSLHSGLSSNDDETESDIDSPHDLAEKLVAAVVGVDVVGTDAADVLAGEEEKQAAHVDDVSDETVEPEEEHDSDSVASRVSTPVAGYIKAKTDSNLMGAIADNHVDDSEPSDVTSPFHKVRARRDALRRRLHRAKTLNSEEFARSRGLIQSYREAQQDSGSQQEKQRISMTPVRAARRYKRSVTMQLTAKGAVPAVSVSKVSSGNGQSSITQDDGGRERTPDRAHRQWTKASGARVRTRSVPRQRSAPHGRLPRPPSQRPQPPSADACDAAPTPEECNTLAVQVCSPTRVSDNSYSSSSLRSASSITNEATTWMGSSAASDASCSPQPTQDEQIVQGAGSQETVVQDAAAQDAAVESSMMWLTLAGPGVSDLRRQLVSLEQRAETEGINIDAPSQTLSVRAQQLVRELTCVRHLMTLRLQAELLQDHLKTVDHRRKREREAAAEALNRMRSEMEQKHKRESARIHRRLERMERALLDRGVVVSDSSDGSDDESDLAEST